MDEQSGEDKLADREEWEWLDDEKLEERRERLVCLGREVRLLPCTLHLDFRTSLALRKKISNSHLSKVKFQVEVLFEGGEIVGCSVFLASFNPWRPSWPT